MPQRIIASLLLLTLAIACEREGSSGAAAPAADQAAMHEGQGEEISTDPQFQIKLLIASGGGGGAGNEQVISGRLFAIYESKPPQGNQPIRPQGFEIAGENFELAGRMPESLVVAPLRKFAELVGKPLEIRDRGGDPSNLAMSKIKLADGKVYRVSPKGGTATVEKAFFRRGKYAGVSGKFEVELQEIKLGDTDDEDPKNDKDAPVGEPVKAGGTFTLGAKSFPYEQL